MITTIFKPKYASTFYVSLVTAILFEAYLLYGIFYCHNYAGMVIFLASLIGLIIILMPFVHIWRITFQDEFFSIEKYISPATTIFYKDIIEIYDLFIKTKHGSVPLGNAVNFEEFQRLLKKHMHKWKPRIHFIVMNKMKKRN